MKTIAYYISDYGFGHATRSTAVIRGMFQGFDGPLKVIVCNSYAVGFLKDSLKGLNIEYRDINTDVGYVLKPNSMILDDKKLERKYQEFSGKWSEKVQAEKEFLINDNIDLVISDISPLPFMPAKELGISSVGVSNFTWLTAYNGIIYEKDLDLFKNAYEHMDYFFSLETSNESSWGTKGTERFGFISRESASGNAIDIVNQINPARDKSIVYFGLGMKIDVDLEDLNLWYSDNCVFIVSSNVDVNLPNVYKIPEEYTESQDYIAAADIVITKVGWGTVSEAILNHKPLLILDRSVMNEDRNTINYLKRINHVKLFGWDELTDMVIDKFLLEELNKQDLYGEVSNDAGEIANKLLGCL